jgi:hypothetical protein
MCVQKIPITFDLRVANFDFDDGSFEMRDQTLICMEGYEVQSTGSNYGQNWG